MKSNRGERMIEFIETLRIPEGMNTGAPFKLRPWQKEIIEAVYNPIHSNNIRVVRKAIFSVAKKGMSLGHSNGGVSKFVIYLKEIKYEKNKENF